MPTDFWETSLGRHPNQLALCKLNFFFTYHCDFTKEEEEESKSVLLSSLCQSNKQTKKHFLDFLIVLVHLSMFLLNVSLPSSSYCTYKPSQKLEEVNRGQSLLLQPVKQLYVWLKTILSCNINIPAGSHSALSPYSFTGSHGGGEVGGGRGGGLRWRRTGELYDLAEILEMVPIWAFQRGIP